MIQILETQTVLGGAEQFDGTPTRGLFRFPFSALEKDRSIIIERLAIYGAGTTANWIEAYWHYAVGFGSVDILIGTAVAATLLTPNGDLAVTLCPGRVPRNADGTFFDLLVFSDGLIAGAQATITGVREDSAP